MNLKLFLNKKVLGTTLLVVGGVIATIVNFKKNDDLIPSIENRELPNKKIT